MDVIISHIIYSDVYVLCSKLCQFCFCQILFKSVYRSYHKKSKIFRDMVHVWTHWTGLQNSHDVPLAYRYFTALSPISHHRTQIPNYHAYQDETLFNKNTLWVISISRIRHTEYPQSRFQTINVWLSKLYYSIAVKGLQPQSSNKMPAWQQT